jgi:DNA polymerase III delta prime subunit
LKQIIETGNIPNLLMSGAAGTGKTSTAIVLCETMGREHIYINGSVETGIDVLRTKIRQFITSTSWDNGKKILIFDEADRFSPQLQDALKSTIEEFSKGCSFIFISNHKNKIIPPLQSRLQSIDFAFTNTELESMKKDFFKSVVNILGKEKVQFSKKVVAHIVQKLFPDMRKTLNELQKYATQGALEDESIVADLSADNTEFYAILKSKNWADMRKFVMSLNSDPQGFYSGLMINCIKYLEPDSLPEFAILLNKYSVESTMVADSRVNLIAFCTEAMMFAGVKDV